jgi:nucleoside triphosphate diphosphatase
VVEAICTKMRRRHPHVFGDKGPLPIDAVNALWATIKQEEKAERAALRKAAGLPQPESGILAGVLPTQPALARAMKLQQRAASVGFDWDDPRPVLAKIKEEIAEVEEALERGNEAAVADEVGDLLFAVTNLARHVGTDAESALHGTCAKVTRRFRHIEQSLAAAGRETNDATLAEMEALWAAAKMLEKPAL